MTDWNALAAALDPPLPADGVAKAAPLLERLEAAMEPMESAVPLDTLPWTEPEAGR
jgi:hypothetical protein